jgi:3-deoxy-D-manno-octulosonate 8-phosphate phosphatase KdsC-like HAD superfamily phosphatase
VNVLQGILSESKEYYLQVREKIKKKLANLSKGSVKKRIIAGKKYYYLQQRVGKKVVHKYLGKRRPEEVVSQIKERKGLNVELRKVNEALRIIKRSEDRRYG